MKTQNRHRAFVSFRIFSLSLKWYERLNKEETSNNGKSCTETNRMRTGMIYMKGSISADKHMLTNTELLSIKKENFIQRWNRWNCKESLKDEQRPVFLTKWLAGQAVAESECDLEDFEPYKQCMRNCPELQIVVIYRIVRYADLRPSNRSKWGKLKTIRMSSGYPENKTNLHCTAFVPQYKLI